LRPTPRRVAVEARCSTGALTDYFAIATRGWSKCCAALLRRRRAHDRYHAQGQGDRNPVEAIVLEALPLDAEPMEEWKARFAFWSCASDSEALCRENPRCFRE
jgi:hypothetical protein